MFQLSSNGLSASENAIYAAETARSGEAVEVPLGHGEEINIKLMAPKGKQASPRWRDVELDAVVDEGAIIVPAPRGCRLAVNLSRLGYAASDVASLQVRLKDLALIITSNAKRLRARKYDSKSVTITTED